MTGEKSTIYGGFREPAGSDSTYFVTDGTDRLWKATHRCDLADPRNFNLDALISCKVCGQMWSIQRRWLTGQRYWSGIRDSHRTKELCNWRSYGGPPHRWLFSTPPEMKGARHG